ncbi:hypothetical protein EJB05_26847, partial [Eragrostis curvula]
MFYLVESGGGLLYGAQDDQWQEDTASFRERKTHPTRLHSTPVHAPHAPPLTHAAAPPPRRARVAHGARGTPGLAVRLRQRVTLAAAPRRPRPSLCCARVVRALRLRVLDASSTPPAAGFLRVAPCRAFAAATRCRHGHRRATSLRQQEQQAAVVLDGIERHVGPREKCRRLASSSSAQIFDAVHCFEEAMLNPVLNTDLKSVCISRYNMLGDQIVFFENNGEACFKFSNQRQSCCTVYHMRDGKISASLPMISWIHGAASATWLSPEA